MATAEQLRINRLFAAACKANGHQPTTLKHRTLAGTQTTTTAGGSTNTRLRARSGNQAIENTTDYQVWCVWVPLRVRGGSQDGGDATAGRQWDARWFGQCAAVDVNNNPIQIADDDWVVDPAGALIQIENPTVAADGGYFMFGGVQQR